ncbi:hypothetical protein VP01_1267g6, partial [Puccinia sorghi]
PYQTRVQPKDQFILTVVDNHSGYLAGFPLVHKDDTTHVLIQLLEMEKKRLGYFPATICSNGAGKFFGNRLVKFLNDNHIKRLILEPYHREHNGRAERANGTVVRSIRTTFNSSKIPKQFWHEILKSSCLALNQIPRKNNPKSPSYRILTNTRKVRLDQDEELTFKSTEEMTESQNKESPGDTREEKTSPTQKRTHEKRTPLMLNNNSNQLMLSHRFLLWSLYRQGGACGSQQLLPLRTLSRGKLRRAKANKGKYLQSFRLG